MRDASAQATVGRLTKRRDFLAAASGRRFHSERMTLQGRVRTDSEAVAPGLRVGLTITKRVGHATERNRIKRRLRAAMREAGRGEAGTSADIVVLARREAIAADYRLLVEDLERGLKVVTKPKTPKAKTADSQMPRPNPTTSSADCGRRGTSHA